MRWSVPSDDGLPRGEGVRSACGRGGAGPAAGGELWASPAWSSFTRDDMVLVMESAATSRSLRRFLLVPEGSQSRWRCQVGGRGYERAEPMTEPAGPWGSAECLRGPGLWPLPLHLPLLKSRTLSAPRFLAAIKRAGFQNQHHSKVLPGPRQGLTLLCSHLPVCVSTPNRTP